jgi:hypothetical protein
LTPNFRRSSFAGRRLRLLVLAASITACGPSDAERHAAELFTRPDRARIRIGLQDAEQRGGTIGIITAARLSGSGRYVVVLDVIEPYVKIFDRNGRFVRSFGRKGEGPGELPHPTAVAVNGDASVLVADATGRVIAFDLAGHLLDETREPRTVPLTATSACGDWVIYGPRFGTGHLPATWVHRVRLPRGDTAARADALPDSATIDMLPFGVAYGMVADAKGLILWHTFGDADELLSWPCAAGQPSLIYRRSEAYDPGGGRTATSRGTRVAVGPGFRTRGGIAAVPGGIVIAEQVIGRRDDELRTELMLAANGRTTQRIAVQGDFVLRDSRDGVGVLVSSNDPAPHLFVISQQELRDLFRE